MDFNCGRVQFLQAQLFPVCTLTTATTSGFLGSFLSKNLKTNQLEVNTDEKTLRSIARLKEPRDLFALPKDKDHDCPQQAPRWPIECQVLNERIRHIQCPPAQPEPYNVPTGSEVKPRPVGEENGIVVFNYNPISAVNYDKPEKSKQPGDESSDSDSSSDSSPEFSTPDRRKMIMQQNRIVHMLDILRPARPSAGGGVGGGGGGGEAATVVTNARNDESDGVKIKNNTKNKNKNATVSGEDDDETHSNDTNNTSNNINNISSNENTNQEQKVIANKKDPEPNGPYVMETKPAGSAPKPMRYTPFSRSAVGGSKFLTNCHPANDSYDGLEFESRFESGNLAKAVMITPQYYELYLRPDLYTSRSKQWFYFRVKKTKKNLMYRFSIVNLVKSDSLYNEGMRPLLYSTINAKDRCEGWRRCGQNIVYYRNDDESGVDDEDDNASYSLTWNIQFEHDNDTVFFAHSYPYTYSDLQDYLMEIQKHPVKSKFCKLRLLCRSLAGNNVYYLTVTAPSADEDVMKRKKAIVVSARVHPSETPASWMMKGLMDFITGDTMAAKRLRHRFIFKLVPMLNPDGVIVGNTRNSLTGKDLNRQYRTVIRETYPSIWYTKAMIKRLIDECGVTMYCDMHAHSRKHNIFIYGCENRRNSDKKLTEQVFPLMMHKNVADKFSFEDCKFKIQRSKEGTGRIVVWMLGITNSYTIEASFGGSTLGSRRGTHFNTADYEHIGRAFCETLLDYCDDNPNKERLRLKIIERLLREGSSAEEPLNIPLTDYSSDEGHITSSSDNEGKGSFTQSDLEGPCCAPLKAPPCSPETNPEMRRFYQKRMRKVMQELDRVYFQPLFKKKFNALIKTKRSKAKPPLKQDRNKKNNSNSAAKKPPASASASAATATAATAASGQECETSKIGDNVENEKSPSEKRLEFEHSIYNTPEGTRLASGLSRAPTAKQNKKKKSTDDDETGGAEKPPPRKLRVSRKLRLWLTKRNIFIFRKMKKFRNKARGKIFMPKGKASRIAFDMPTTDPGSDLMFSTDDEYVVEGSDALYRRTGRSGTHPRARRLLQSELQRRYMEEFWVNAHAQRRMPPELVITSPTKQTTKKEITNLGFSLKSRQTTLPRTAPAAQLLTEFPIIGAVPAKRTSSWHNLHSGSNKSTPTLRKNPYMPISDNLSRNELEFRLSLKKKIWAGVQSDGATQDEAHYRPLSWGMPPLSMHLKREKTKDKQPSSAIQKDDNVILLDACSQKLIQWQEQRGIPSTSQDNNNNNASTSKARGRFVHNLVTLESSMDDMDSSDLSRQIQFSKTSQKITLKADVPNNNDSKGKKRKNPIMKIAETTQMIARSFTKSKPHASSKNSSSLGSQRRGKISNSTSNTKASNHQTLQPMKFKTGGLVATASVSATAQSKNRKTRGGASNNDVVGSKQTNFPERPYLTIDMQTPMMMVKSTTTTTTTTTTRKSKTKLRKKSKSSNC